MLDIKNKTKVLEGIRPDTLTEEILSSSEPIILKDFACDWPIVIAGKKSTHDADKYLRQFYNGNPVTAYYGEPDIKGRVFYNQDYTGFNFRSSKIDLNLVLDKLLENINVGESPTMYVGSTEINQWLPGFGKQNHIPIEQYNPLVSIWIGNQSRVAAHFDFPKNLACSAVGRRRFTLFPPEQVKNLYIGPMEFAPGGQEISVVDFHNPDYDKFPRFKDAVAAAEEAVLEPGDTLFLPSMWWHHVEALTDYNVLLTHWWRESAAFMGRPTNALSLAMLSLRSLSKTERMAWKAIFEHYVFDYEDDQFDYLPEAARGMLTLPLDEINARKLRVDLLEKLKR